MIRRSTLWLRFAKPLLGEGGHAVGRRSSSSAAKQEASSKSSLQFSPKMRPPKRPRIVTEEVTKPRADWNIWGYATCEEYHLRDLVKQLKADDRFEVLMVAKQLSNVIHVVPSVKLCEEDLRGAFVFGEGVVVFWDFGADERTALLEYVRPFEQSAYDWAVVQQEEETLKYCLTQAARSEFVGETLYLQAKTTDKQRLERFAVSHAVAVSVKLSIWESLLEDLMDSLEVVAEDLKHGRISLSKSQVLRKAGYLFMLRHHINYGSDILDTPDFYWDEEELERLYVRACSIFNVTKRSRVVNERLTYCMELLQLLDGSIADKHNIHLEVMIIILILIEVLFETMHYFERHRSFERAVLSTEAKA